MVAKIDAGSNVKRGDFFFVDPFEVEIREELRGRHKPPTDDRVVNRAISILDIGQIHAVECRRNEKNRLVLTAGFTRAAAVRLIRTGFDYEGQHYHDPEIRLKVSLTDANDATAFKRNVVENAQRDDTSPVDDALNQQRLRDSYGMSDADIARLYGYQQTKVGTLRKLLQLKSDWQDMVHDGRLPVSAALLILELPEAERASAIEQATQESGKINGAALTGIVREHHLNDNNRVPKETSENNVENEKPAKARSVRELKKFFEFRAATENKFDPAIQRFSKDILLYITGRSTDQQMQNALKRLLDATAKSDEEPELVKVPISKNEEKELEDQLNELDEMEDEMEDEYDDEDDEMEDEMYDDDEEDDEEDEEDEDEDEDE
jgi:hypothetical protein